MSTADEKWYFTKEQLANTPSRRSGYDADKELSYRQQAANFIQDMGQRLVVTQLCINTAIVYMHRFYLFHSLQQFHRNAIAAAALFLAAKVEEQPRKLEHVIKVAHMCLKNASLETKSEQYLEQAQDLVFNENVLLQTLGFEVAIDHPHTHVVRCCQLVKASKELAQTSYFMASNSLHLTTMCLQYKPTVVACFCIHLACKWSNWEIPQSNEGKNWFWYVDKTVTTELLQHLTSDFLQIFDKCPSRLKRKMMSMSANQSPNMTHPSVPNSPFESEPRKIQSPANAENSFFQINRLHYEKEDKKSSTSSLSAAKPLYDFQNKSKDYGERPSDSKDKSTPNFLGLPSLDASKHHPHPKQQQQQQQQQMPGLAGKNVSTSTSSSSSSSSGMIKNSFRHHHHSQKIDPKLANLMHQQSSSASQSKQQPPGSGSKQQSRSSNHPYAVYHQPPHNFHNNSVDGTLNNSLDLSDKKHQAVQQQQQQQQQLKKPVNKARYYNDKKTTEDIRKLIEKPLPLKEEYDPLRLKQQQQQQHNNSLPQLKKEISSSMPNLSTAKDNILPKKEVVVKPEKLSQQPQPPSNSFVKQRSLFSPEKTPNETSLGGPKFFSKEPLLFGTENAESFINSFIKKDMVEKPAPPLPTLPPPPSASALPIITNFPPLQPKEEPKPPPPPQLPSLLNDSFDHPPSFFSVKTEPLEPQFPPPPPPKPFAQDHMVVPSNISPMKTAQTISALLQEPLAPIPSLIQPPVQTPKPPEPVAPALDALKSEKSSKSEKKKKKEKHKHRDREKGSKEKHKHKHKDKDKDKSKSSRGSSSHSSSQKNGERSTGSELSTTIKITIPKDKLVDVPDSVTNNSGGSSKPPDSGLKIKIPKDRLKGSEIPNVMNLTRVEQQRTQHQTTAPLKIKIRTDSLSRSVDHHHHYHGHHHQSTSSGVEGRKRPAEAMDSLNRILEQQPPMKKLQPSQDDAMNYLNKK